MYLRVIYWYFYALSNIPHLKSLADASYPETSLLKTPKKAQAPNLQQRYVILKVNNLQC